MPDSQAEFLKDLDPQNNSLERSIAIDEVSEEETTEEQSNRRERRLQAKLQAERESSIALAARLEALTEAQKFSRENTPEVDETIARIYGTNTPEAAEATALLQRALQNVENRSTEKALEKFREEQKSERGAVQKESATLDSMVDQIEDEYHTTMDAQSKRAFFTLLERLSPKDSDGEIKEYADHNAVWEELQSRKTTQNSRAKDLASRSMVRTGASTGTSTEANANERWLKENGII